MLGVGGICDYELEVGDVSIVMGRPLCASAQYSRNAWILGPCALICSSSCSHGGAGAPSVRCMLPVNTGKLALWIQPCGQSLGQSASRSVGRSVGRISMLGRHT
jgi:hypothetical protein